MTRSRSASVCKHVERRHDVGVPDARGEARLVEEHERELVLARQVWVRALDGDGAREAGRPEQAREVHRGHPPEAISA